MYVVLTDSRSYETEDEGHNRRKLYEILLQRTKCQVSKSVESCMKLLFSTVRSPSIHKPCKRNIN